MCGITKVVIEPTEKDMGREGGEVREIGEVGEVPEEADDVNFRVGFTLSDFSDRFDFSGFLIIHRP